MKNPYEIVYIVDADLQEVDLVQNKINNLLDLVDVEHRSLGVKKFSYPIKKKFTGHYFLLKTEQTGDKINHVAREMRWIPEILRFLVVNLSKEKHFRISPSRSKYLTERDKRNRRNWNSNLIATPDKVAFVSLDKKETANKNFPPEDKSSSDPKSMPD